MPSYRRSREGNTYFFTVVTYDRRRIPCLDPARAALREPVLKVRESYPLVIEAWVLLPDHIHCIWRLPKGDTDYSIRWALIKKNFTQETRTWLDLPRGSESRRRHREGTVWQRRFWEHTIRDEEDFSAHCDYIHCNPVKHGLVQVVGQWPHSTFHRFVEQGVYPADWGTTEVTLPDLAGNE